jgi:membrane protease YdiL (CAAX protease family)
MLQYSSNILLKIKANKNTFFLLLLTCIIVLYTGFRHQQIAQSCVYIFTCCCSFILIDLFALKSPINDDFVIKHPRKETIIFFSCLIGGLLFMFFRFSGYVDWEHLNGLIKLALIPLILCVFPIALAISLFLMRYTPKALGLKFQGVWWAFPIILIFALASRIVAPERLTWDLLMAEEGSIGNLIFTGLIVAGLSEEFFKAIGQTRFGALMNNKGLAWFITTFIWAFMHAPKWYGENHDVLETALSSIRIIPIGLVWGYLTHRTKSFVPATLVHGANFWGLQNF